MRRAITSLAAGLALAATALPCAAADFRPLGAYLDGLVSSGSYPGASVLVLQHGKEAYYAQAGMADREAARPLRRDSIVRIYSMTKPVTTAAVMILVDEGKLRLDDPVTKYIPEFTDLRVYKGMDGTQMLTEPARPMTVENLLTHTAGFSYAFQPGEPVAALYRKTPLAADAWRFDPAFKGGEALARTLASLPLVAQPGDHWHYSMSLDVAALVVQRASGVPFEDFVRARIFEPLGMSDTGFSVDPAKADRLASLYTRTPAGLQKTDDGRTSQLLRPLGGFSGGGGLLSTIDDYARFCRMLADHGTGEGHRILSRQAVTAMMSNHLSPAQLNEMKATAAFGLGGEGDGLGFGYGGAVVTSTAALGGVGSVGEYAWGGAASTTFWIDPVQDVVVIFMTQVLPPGADRLRDRLRQLTYAALRKP